MNARMSLTRLGQAVVILATLGCADAWAFTPPQERWIIEDHLGWEVPSPWDVEELEGKLYVTCEDGFVRVYTPQGDLVDQFGGNGTGDGQFSSPRGIAEHDGLLYVAEHGANRIQVVTTNGTHIRKWGSGGLGDDDVYTPIDVALDDQHLYVTEHSSHRIKVFTHDGQYVRKWGTEGSLVGQLKNPWGIAVDASHVYVADLSNRRVQVFTKNGLFVREWTPLKPDSGNQVSYGPYCLALHGGSVFASYGRVPSGRINWLSGITVANKGGDIAWWLMTSQGNKNHYYPPLNHPRGLVVRDPFMYVVDNDHNHLLPCRRVFRTLGTMASQSNSVPVGDVLLTRQRHGSSVLDIDYTVVDDDSVVTAYAAAFAPGDPGIDTIIPMSGLIEGTDLNVGTGVVVGVTNRLSWDVSQDWQEHYGNVRVAILAKDGRELLDVHFLHLPPDGSNSTLVISRLPVVAHDLLNLWFWLIAKQEPTMRLDEGRVYGVGGAHDGVLLAEGSTTTDAGREFLFSYLGLRQATAEELVRAREAGTPGSVTQWDSRYEVPRSEDNYLTYHIGRVDTRGRPRKVNEYGFDTHSTDIDGWWVVRE